VFHLWLGIYQISHIEDQISDIIQYPIANPACLAGAILTGLASRIGLNIQYPSEVRKLKSSYLEIDYRILVIGYCLGFIRG
jgi:hypothetical protein